MAGIDDIFKGNVGIGVAAGIAAAIMRLAGGLVLGWIAVRLLLPDDLEGVGIRSDNGNLFAAIKTSSSLTSP